MERQKICRGIKRTYARRKNASFKKFKKGRRNEFPSKAGQ
jgi:hypothetical protein